jgi:hypothetical protein
MKLSIVQPDANYIVAQLSNLLSRSASSLHGVKRIRRHEKVGRPADWKSAMQRVGKLRYFHGIFAPLRLIKFLLPFPRAR